MKDLTILIQSRLNKRLTGVDKLLHLLEKIKVYYFGPVAYIADTTKVVSAEDVLEWFTDSVDVDAVMSEGMVLLSDLREIFDNLSACDYLLKDNLFMETGSALTAEWRESPDKDSGFIIEIGYMLVTGSKPDYNKARYEINEFIITEKRVSEDSLADYSFSVFDNQLPYTEFIAFIQENLNKLNKILIQFQ